MALTLRLSDVHQIEIERIKELTGIKTSSKAIEYALERFLGTHDRNERLSDQVDKLIHENNNLKGMIYELRNSFNNLNNFE